VKTDYDHNPPLTVRGPLVPGLPGAIFMDQANAWSPLYFALAGGRIPLIKGLVGQGPVIPVIARSRAIRRKVCHSTSFESLSRVGDLIPDADFMIFRNESIGSVQWVGRGLNPDCKISEILRGQSAPPTKFRPQRGNQGRKRERERPEIDRSPNGERFVGDRSRLSNGGRAFEFDLKKVIGNPVDWVRRVANGFDFTSRPKCCVSLSVDRRADLEAIGKSQRISDTSLSEGTGDRKISNLDSIQVGSRPTREKLAHECLSFGLAPGIAQA